MSNTRSPGKTKMGGKGTFENGGGLFGVCWVANFEGGLLAHLGGDQITKLGARGKVLRPQCQALGG